MPLDEATRKTLGAALGIDPAKVGDKPADGASATPPDTKVDTGLPEGAADAATLLKGFEGVDVAKALDNKPAEKPVEKPAEEPDLTTKDGRAYAAMRKQIKELTDHLTAVKQGQSAAPAPEALQKLQEQLQAKDAELTKLADQVGMLDLERDPRFRAKYGQAEEVINGQIKDLAKELDIADDVVARVMAASLKQRIEILTEEAGASAPIMLTILSQRDALYKQKQIELGRHREIRQQMDQQQGTQDLALEQQARVRLFDGALTAAREQGHFVFQPDADNPDRNALADKAVGLAKELFASNDGARQAQAMMMGVAAPVYLHMLKMERARSTQLEGELKRRFGKVPGISGNGGGPASAPGAGEVPKSMTPDEAAAAVMSRMKRV